jgi:integrase
VRLYVEAGRSTRAPRTTQDYCDFLKAELRGQIGDLPTPVHRVTLRHLLGAIAAKAPTHANRLWSLIRASLRWAVNEGLLANTGVEGLPRPGGRELPRDRVLSDSELRELLRGVPTGRPRLFLWLALLTAQRTGEVLGMEWNHVDLTAGLWSLPASHCKDRRPHTVPLVPQAVGLLRDTGPNARGLVLRGLHANPGRLAARIRKAVPQVKEWRLYDTRRTAATGLARLGAEPVLVERTLGHAIPGVGAIYNRHAYLPEMRAALDRWEAHLLAL